MKYAALYSRVSTSNQNTGLESQERALELFAQQNNITNYKKFSDSNVSGSKASRPQLDSMMKEIEEGKLSKVVVYSFSRFARSTKHLLSALEYFKNKNVEFVSISEKVDTSSPMGKALFGIISIISELERELISERVINGLKNAKAKGKIIGRPKTRPSQSIISLHQENYSYREIAKILGVSHTSVAREIKSMKCNQNNFEETLRTDD